MDISKDSGKSDKPEMLTFFDQKMSRQNSESDIELRSRSISSASNNSLPDYLKKNMGHKKYWNLAAMDGFAMVEKDNEEEKEGLNQTILKGMDVESICADIEDGQKQYHLDKLFNPQGPYYTQTQLFQQEQRSKEKRKKREKSMNCQGNFLDKIDTSLYKQDSDENKNFGLVSLFETPMEKEVRVAGIIKNKKKLKYKETAVQTEGKVTVMHDELEEDKESNFKNSNPTIGRVAAQNSMVGKMTLLNSFKDHEVLNAFKLALLNTENGEDILTENEFFNQLGKSFIELLRNKPEPVNCELEKKLSQLNIQSDSQPDSRPISDFGDIIPVDLDMDLNNFSKQQKWTLAEQKKLSGFIGARNLKEITELEWIKISNKLGRTQNSVVQKAHEIFLRVPSINKKRKVTENPQLNSVNDTISNISAFKKDAFATTSLACSELDCQTDQARSERTDSLCISRKRAIETVLEKLPNRRGTKNQIFEAMQKEFDLPLSDKSSSQYKGFHQCLSKYFRQVKGYYAIKTASSEYEILNKNLRSLDKCHSWKEKTFFVLNQFPEKKARLDEIRSKITQVVSEAEAEGSQAYHDQINVWERNLLKMFSKHKSIFDTSNSKPIFYIC